ncbi:MAG TPA: phosphoglycerate dehydrogenase, partial [Verrucomicrobiales bacterium]|nr:phosphoglycerate dehydrogenase [Verrucomicrobiales bacterium]
MSSHRVLVADPISEHGVTLLNDHPDITADFIPDLGSQPDKLMEIIGDYDALIVRSQTKPNAEVIARGSRLRAIGRAGVGVDNIDREAASAHGVIVMNTPTGNTVSTAEHAFALMLATARNIAPAHAGVLAGDFKSSRKAFSGIEMNG